MKISELQTASGLTTRGLRPNQAILPGTTGTEGEPVMSYASKLTKDDAESQLRGLIAGPYARLNKLYGSTVPINDAIPRKGSSRETGTPGSLHFAGAALDLSTAGMDDSAKRRLVAAAVAAGFTGFGFGETFLHVDTGRTRFWDYGNSKFGGMPVTALGQFIKTNAGSA